MIPDSLIHQHELDECSLVWLPRDESSRADYVNQTTRLEPGDESPTLWVRVIAHGEEWWFGAWRAHGIIG